MRGKSGKELHVKSIPGVFIRLFLFTIALSACSGPAPMAATTPTLVSGCMEKGTIGHERVPDPEQGFPISFTYYLPPCYTGLAPQSFPVFYMITSSSETRLSETDNTPISLAERLIHSGKMPPVILIEPSLPVGYGSDAALVKDLVPYVDSQFRTIPNREQRAVGGISHGAAIAVRMAFQFPDTFGSVGLLSGGLDGSELERFEGWVLRTPPERWPRVLIDVGDQDAIMSLTHNLIMVLDKHNVPYTLNIGQGNHNWVFWSTQMESYLLWLSKEWKR
jgi:enterochelin esterase-like enzyme